VTCDDAIVPLTDRLDGELDPDVARALDEHLAGCAACRDLAADLERLRVAARALPREVEPPRDLWVGISERITPRRSSGWSRGWLAAAAVLIAIGSSALTAVWLDRTPPAEVASAADWERAYDDASTELRAALASRRHELDPATLAVVDENLRIIDRAVEDTRRALATAPDDEALRRSLVAVNEQRITLLRRALALPRDT
jgi:anti-sigma factor RsiW